MALLTAEDVLNKAFSKTKYREGFDQDEVDDFLDEVAHTVTSLIAERDELAARLQQAQSGGSSASEAPPLTEAGGIPGTSGLLGAATDPNPPSPAGMLAMAQKLHDEYVNAGEEEKDRIIDEAKTKAESIVEQAQEDAKGRMDDLASERSELERKIDDLRRFERDYRARIKSFLENLLGDLDHGTSREAPTTPAADDDASVAGLAAAASVEWPSPAQTDDDAEDNSDDSEEASDHDEDASTSDTSSSDEHSSSDDDSGSHDDSSSDDSEGHEFTPSHDSAESEDNAPPVRQSFGYQPPTQAPQNGYDGGEHSDANPFAPVTQQQPIVSQGDAGEGDSHEQPRYPNAF